MADRYRCTACGNLTRFDVVASRRTREFHHYGLDGELKVEESELLSETIDEVSCRWCASPKAVEVVPPGAELSAPGEAEPAAPAGSRLAATG